jgi:beta-lactamase regulating signal transducer with metallopeptidase domain
MPIFLEPLVLSSSSWVEFILEMTLKAVLVLGIAFVILLVGKRFSFATRHLILTFAVVSLLLLPLVSHILPAWNLSFLPSVLPQEIQPANSPPPAQVESITSPSHFGPIPYSSSNIIRRTRSDSIPWPTWIFIVWIAGASVVSIRLIAGSIGTRLLIHHATPVKNHSLHDLLTTHAKKLSIKRKIRLLQTPRALVPLTCGFFRPSILLPKGAGDWPEKRKEIVLLHELAHIKRGDFLLSFLTRMASILYWFNPLIWIAIKRLAIEREHASDDCVLAAGTKASEYASHLLEIAKKASSQTWFSPAGITIAKKSNLEARIMSILNKSRPIGQMKLSTILLTGFLALSLIIPLASVHTWAQNEKPQEKEQEKPEKAKEIMDKEEIKKVLREFFECIEKLDFSKALTFFADEPEIEITDDAPLIIVKSGKKVDDKNIVLYNVDDLKRIQIKSDIKTIAKDTAAVRVDGRIAVIGTDKGDVKRIFFDKEDGHTLILNLEDGKWKICADALHLNFIKDDIDKESKKVGLCFTDDGVTYIIMRISPHITVLKKGKKIEKKKI